MNVGSSEQMKSMKKVMLLSVKYLKQNQWESSLNWIIEFLTTKICLFSAIFISILLLQ